MTNNERVVEQARRACGLEAGNPAQRAQWLELLGPGQWPLDKPYGKGGMSLCAVTAIGILRLAGATIAQAPYRIGAGLRDQIDAAGREPPYGAWIEPGRCTGRPEPGDVVEQLPVPSNPGGSTHVLTCVGWDGDYLLSVDGGQVCARDGLQAVYSRRRLWHDVAGAVHLGGKPVHGWIAARLIEFSA